MPNSNSATGRSRVQVQGEVEEDSGGCCTAWGLCGHNPPMIFMNFVLVGTLSFGWRLLFVNRCAQDPM